MTHWAAAGGREEDARILVAGDWVHMPANAPHISKCFPGEDCVAVVVQKGKFDFIVSGR
jgi:quercetin dioxygenase-like cupin family protein